LSLLKWKKYSRMNYARCKCNRLSSFIHSTNSLLSVNSRDYKSVITDISYFPLNIVTRSMIMFYYLLFYFIPRENRIQHVLSTWIISFCFTFMSSNIKHKTEVLSLSSTFIPLFFRSPPATYYLSPNFINFRINFLLYHLKYFKLVYICMRCVVWENRRKIVWDCMNGTVKKKGSDDNYSARYNEIIVTRSMFCSAFLSSYEHFEMS
jgi:hypothetical protein